MVWHKTGNSPDYPPTLPEPETETSLPHGYWSIRKTLKDEGIPFVCGHLINQGSLLPQIADLSYPLVMKAIDLLHKTDQGGVILNICDEEKLKQAYETLTTKFPDSAISVEQQVNIHDGFELLVGVKSDPRFGSVITVGMGGIYTEIFNQVAVALAPIDQASAKQLIESLKSSTLLKGARGKPVLDIDSAAAVVSQLSAFGSRNRHKMASLEINPLLVLPDTAVALDVRLIAK